MKKELTLEQEEAIDTIYNLIWYRITDDDKYLNAIPEIDSGNFHDWIYYIKYEFLEYDDSVIQAVVYLNGQYYTYIQTPQFLNNIWVDEIDETEVKKTIIELGGEIYDGFELYNNTLTDDDEFLPTQLDELNEDDYYDYFHSEYES